MIFFPLDLKTKIWPLARKQMCMDLIKLQRKSNIQIRSDKISRSVISDTLQPHESQQPSLPVHHQLLEFTQTHVHRVSDAIQPSHPLASPSPPAPNPSQHQSLFQ